MHSRDFLKVYQWVRRTAVGGGGCYCRLNFVFIWSGKFYCYHGKVREKSCGKHALEGSTRIPVPGLRTVSSCKLDIKKFTSSEVYTLMKQSQFLHHISSLEIESLNLMVPRETVHLFPKNFNLSFFLRGVLTSD